MPRQSRKQSETEIYHIMIRGINKEYVFKNNTYKRYFKDGIERSEKSGLFEVISWCIMDNHAHLLVKASLMDLSKAVKIMCLKHAAYYNASENRIGPVFGDRYRSEVVENDVYLLQVLRYIFNNPVKARLVKTPKDYPWSNYNSFLHEDSLRKEAKKMSIMALFNHNIAAFTDFIRQIDKNEYLETKEDLEKYRIEAGQDIIQEYFKSKGIVNEKELRINSEWIDELVQKMLVGSKLTLRQVAKLTGLSVSLVYKKVVNVKDSGQ